MEQHFKSVPVLSIGEINASSGKGQLGNEFHVTLSNELLGSSKFEKPVKADHFVFILSLSGTTFMRYNLLDYQIRPNDLFIVTPGIIHKFHTDASGVLIGIGFSNSFFSETWLHKDNMNVFKLLYTNANPHFTLDEADAATIYNLMLMLKNLTLTKAMRLNKIQ